MRDYLYDSKQLADSLNRGEISILILNYFRMLEVYECNVVNRELVFKVLGGYLLNS